MITTILRVSWLSLRRDRVALALTFVLPIFFFSVFAAVFGRMDERRTEPLDAALVVEDDSDWARRLREILRDDRGLSLVTADRQGLALDRSGAVRLVREGRVDIAIVIPAGLGSTSSGSRWAGVEVVVYADSANPMAEQLSVGLVQAGVLRLGYELLSEFSPAAAAGIASAAAGRAPVTVRVENVLGQDGKRPSIAFFAAGIGVMFLLFTVSGRSAILIEERESGVLTRLLASRLGLGRLLLGRWLFLVAVGAVQVTIMFVWGSIAFGLELWVPRHLAGFAVITGATAAAAAGFGLLLATCCKSRAQLNGVASVLILVMSVLGGSMFPRFLMPDELKRLGLLTFNAWALDGYQKVFWYEAQPLQLWPQVAVLLGLTLLFLAASRRVAGRWHLG